MVLKLSLNTDLLSFTLLGQLYQTQIMQKVGYNIFTGWSSVGEALYKRYSANVLPERGRKTLLSMILSLEYFQQSQR